jgi:hypothetical protein
MAHAATDEVFHDHRMNSFRQGGTGATVYHSIVTNL